MKAAALLIAAIMIGFFLPGVGESINDFRSREYVEPHIVTTGAVVEADVVLTQSLFSSATANVVITSNNTLDAPVPHAYVSATKTLTVAGLAQNADRNLSVVYRIDALEDYWGAGIASRAILAMVVLGMFGLIGAAVYAGTRRGE